MNSSLLTTISKVNTNSKEFLWPAGYEVTPGKLLVLSESCQYIYYNTNSNEIIGEGILQGGYGSPPNANDTKFTADNAVNGPYCFWFCQYHGDKILYYDIQAECLKIFNLSQPDDAPVQWSGEVKVLRKQIHSFIWLHYDQGENTAYLLHKEEGDKIQLDKITQNGEASKVADCECQNVCWMLKNVRIKNGDFQLFFAVNVLEKFPIFCATKSGICQITFEVKDKCLVEIGLLTNDKMLILYNSGSDTVSQVGCLMIDFSLHNLTEPEVKIEQNNAEDIVLHREENYGPNSDGIAVDGYWAINRIMSLVVVCTSANELAPFSLFMKDGKQEALKVKRIQPDLTHFCDVANVFSLDRSSLYSIETDNNEVNSFWVASHKQTNLKCMYAWIMNEINGKEQLYDPGDIFNIIEKLM